MSAEFLRKIRYVGRHFEKMLADIWRKTQYVGWSLKLEQLRNFYNVLVSVCKMSR